MGLDRFISDYLDFIFSVSPVGFISSYPCFDTANFLYKSGFLSDSHYINPTG